MCGDWWWQEQSGLHIEEVPKCATSSQFSVFIFPETYKGLHESLPFFLPFFQVSFCFANAQEITEPFSILVPTI